MAGLSKTNKQTKGPHLELLIFAPGPALNSLAVVLEAYFPDYTVMDLKDGDSKYRIMHVKGVSFPGFCLALIWPLLDAYLQFLLLIFLFLFDC